MTDPTLSREPRNPFFEGLAHWVVRGRWVVLLGTLALVVWMGWVAKTQVKVNTSVEAFAMNQGETHQTLEAFRADFGSDNLYFILAEGDVFTLPFLKRLHALHTAMSTLQVKLVDYGSNPSVTNPTPKNKAPADDEFGDFGDDDGWGDESTGSLVEQTISLINARKTEIRNETLTVGKLLDPLPTEDKLPALRDEVLADKTLVGQVVGRGGRHAVVGIRMPLLSQNDADRVAKALAVLAERFNSPEFITKTVGLPPLNQSLNALMLDDLGRMTMVAVVTMFFVLFVLFRHPLGIFPPLFVVFASAMITGGSVALTGMSLTMLSNILPAFLFCVGIGHSVHLISVYRDCVAEGLESRDAVIHALSTTGLPIFYTSLTTMVGLLSFHFASLPAIREMGYMGAYAVFVAFILSVTVLPASLTFNRRSLMGRKVQGKRDIIDRFLDLCLTTSGTLDDSGFGAEPAEGRSRRKRSLLIMAVLLVMGTAGAFTLRVWHNPLSWVPESEPIRGAFETMDKHVGGTATVTILIDAPPGQSVKDRKLMLAMEKLEAHVRAYSDPSEGLIVGNAISLLDIIKESWRAYNGGRQEDYVIPPSTAGVSDMIEMFQNSGADDLRRLAVTDLSRTQMTMRVFWLEATAYRRLTNHLEAGIKAFIPPEYKARPTGSVYTLVTTIEQLLWDLMKSFGVAFVVITFIMMLLLRSLKLGLIAMVPNLMPIVLIMGLMGVTDIPIDMSTLLIASISIGLAVDDTIHFLHHFRVNYVASQNLEVGIRRSMVHSGRAMVSTTVILMLGFFTYMSGNMQNIQRFGFLVGATAVLALLIDLFFAPTLLRTFYPRSPLEDNDDDMVTGTKPA